MDKPPVSTHLDLGFLLARCRLIDGHFNGLLIVGDHDGAQGTELGVQLFVIHGPEAVEEQVLLVPAQVTRGTVKPLFHPHSNEALLWLHQP